MTISRDWASIRLANDLEEIVPTVALLKWMRPLLRFTSPSASSSRALLQSLLVIFRLARTHYVAFNDPQYGDILLEVVCGITITPNRTKVCYTCVMAPHSHKGSRELYKNVWKSYRISIQQTDDVEEFWRQVEESGKQIEL